MRLADVPVSATIVPMLFQALDAPLSSATLVGEVVASDSGLAASVLAVANSAAFGRARQISEIEVAVALIGVDLVKTLAIAGSSHLLDGAGGLPHVRQHAIETACASRLVAASIGLPEADAFAAGLLHDVGEIMLWQDDPDAYAAAYADWHDIDAQLQGERGMFGADHATAARERLTEWCLPGAVIDAVGDHHRPDLSHRDLSTVVAAAEDLVGPDGTSSDSDRLGLGVDELQRIRAELVDQIQEMRALLGLFSAAQGPATPACAGVTGETPNDV